jgi:hypothetical protein
MLDIHLLPDLRSIGVKGRIFFEKLKSKIVPSTSIFAHLEVIICIFEPWTETLRPSNIIQKATSNSSRTLFVCKLRRLSTMYLHASSKKFSSHVVFLFIFSLRDSFTKLKMLDLVLYVLCKSSNITGRIVRICMKFLRRRQNVHI